MYPVKTSEPINHSVQNIYAPFSSSSFSSTIHVKKKIPTTIISHNFKKNKSRKQFFKGF